MSESSESSFTPTISFISAAKDGWNITRLHFFLSFFAFFLFLLTFGLIFGPSLVAGVDYVELTNSTSSTAGENDDNSISTFTPDLEWLTNGFLLLFRNLVITGLGSIPVVTALSVLTGRFYSSSKTLGRVGSKVTLVLFYLSILFVMYILNFALTFLLFLFFDALPAVEFGLGSFKFVLTSIPLLLAFIISTLILLITSFSLPILYNENLPPSVSVLRSVALSISAFLPLLYLFIIDLFIVRIIVPFVTIIVYLFIQSIPGAEIIALILASSLFSVFYVFQYSTFAVLYWNAKKLPQNIPLYESN